MDLLDFSLRLLGHFEDHPDNSFTAVQLEFWRLLVKVRFDTGAIINYEDEIKSRVFDFSEFSVLSIAAFFGNRVDITHQIIKDERVQESLTIDYFNRVISGRISRLQVFLNLFDFFPEFEKDIFYSHCLFLVSSLYDAISIVENEDGRLMIDFRIKSNYKRQSLPESFNFLYTISTDPVCNSFFLTALLGNNQNADENVFLSLLESLPQIFETRGGISNIKPVEVTNAVAEKIIKSEHLRNLLRRCGLKLKTDHVIFAKLLKESDVVLLQGIFIIEHIDGLFPAHGLFPALSSNAQFRNLEQFTDKTIADLILNSIIFASVHFNFTPNQIFFKFRLALHYWFEGPEKQRLLDNRVPKEIRSLLAKELYIEDAKFLEID